MNPIVSSARSPARVIVLRLAWVAAGLTFATLCVNFLAIVYGKYHVVSPEAYTMFWTRRAWLWTHLAGGATTLLLGAFQFANRWPRLHPRLHRWSGRVYLGAMLVGSVGAAGLIATSPAPFGIRAAFAATGVAWLATAGLGLRAILRGEARVHRRWMICNYLVTLSPVTFRMALEAYVGLGHAPTPEIIAMLLWASWVVPVTLYTLGIGSGRTGKTGRQFLRSIT